jgi:RNase P protein component
MIKKIYRLKEREVKKVLSSSKPFFSYGLVLNIKPNKKAFNRFGIVIWSKSVNTNVTRTFFRRKFYDFVANSSLFTLNNTINKNYDLVFVVKKQTKLDKKDKETIVLFEKDLSFVERKIKK